MAPVKDNDRVMNRPITIDDINDSVRKSVYTQSYGHAKTIHGVETLSRTHHVSEDSDFVEIFKLNAHGHLEDMPSFHVRQISRSLQYPGAIKAWHLHFIQDELWYVPTDAHLIVGLWDIRKTSPTNGIISRLVMGKSGPTMLLIPAGVAHGSVNLTSQPVPILYCASEQFDLQNPDEHRLPWDIQGRDFWKPQRD